MQNKISLISPEIKEILNLPDKDAKVREIFADLHPRDIFALCEELEPQQNAEIIMALSRPLGIEFFEEFKVRQQLEIFRYFPREWMGHILDVRIPPQSCHP